MSTILQDVANILTWPTERVNNWHWQFSVFDKLAFTFPKSRKSPWEQGRELMHELHLTNNTLIVSTNRYIDHLRLLEEKMWGENWVFLRELNSHKILFFFWLHRQRAQILFYELLLALSDCDDRAFRSCCCWWNQRRWRLGMMPMIPSHAMYWEHKDYFIRTRVRSLFYPYN